MFNIQKQSGKPLYQQIIEGIEAAIISGKLSPGERLPSERDLSIWLNVNRSTVIRALDELAERNIIIKKLGSGTYVNDQKWGLLTYPSFNWRNNIVDSYQQLPSFQPTSTQSNHDLRNGDLPIDLYPSLKLPEWDWQSLILAEQQDNVQLGILSLRESVQRYLKTRFSFTVPVEQIMITSGAQQAISLIALGLLKPGDAIGIEQPSYFYALPIFQSVGLRIYGIPVDQHGLSIERLDELVHKHSLKMLFVNPNFQNPTGSVMPMNRKKALMDFCRRKNLPIVEDDAYSQLSFYSTVDTSPIKQLDIEGQTIYIGSLSKYLGKSIRIGWMIAPESVVNHLANIRQKLDSGLSALPQVMAEHYLNHYAFTHEEKLRKELHQRAQNCVQWLKSTLPNDYQFDLPLGGFHLYLTHKNATKNIIDSLATMNILALSCEYFGDKKLQNSARLSFTHFTNES
ncbi:PLP-dependent aminotransferase family protein [Wohlfahrtiimonas larvae]|uniref:PLP-dependent aminotransferase family protein n=1 Tax=Wohlfahrtiimonas larvae TaxID=1157986 RepID=A0ABP9MEJ6_9GAMM|nr:PLP-dependent aminotransferase family protein [Wohlfahrtiimonas larvae]